MKKLIIILSFLFSSVLIANAQQWDSLGGGVLAPTVGYAIVSEIFYNGNLYIGGSFPLAGGEGNQYKGAVRVNNIAEWNGIKWQDVAGGTGTGLFSVINALCIYDGQLYAGGGFDSIGGKPILSIARWNGITWSTVGTKMSNNYINTMCVYNGDLYAGVYLIA